MRGSTASKEMVNDLALRKRGGRCLTIRYCSAGSCPQAGKSSQTAGSMIRWRYCQRGSEVEDGIWNLWGGFQRPSYVAAMSQRASYIGAIQADQTVESDHSDLLVQWGTRLPGHVLLQV
jgi:hypothetical protein